MKTLHNFNTGANFKFDDVKNAQLRNIIKDILEIKSIHQIHIETIDGSLYVCLFDVSQLCCKHIVNVLKKHNIDCKSFVTDCDYGMSYLPTTSIETEELELFEEELMIFDY